MFTAALFTIARTWKQPRCPLADKWIRKLWYIYTMEYYSAMKRNTFESLILGQYLGEDGLDHMVNTRLNIGETVKLFSQLIVLFYVLTSSI